MVCEGELEEASNSCIQDMGSSPLGIASERGHMQTVKTLLGLGAHINHLNKCDTVQTLIKCGSVDPSHHSIESHSVGSILAGSLLVHFPSTHIWPEYRLVHIALVQTPT